MSFDGMRRPSFSQANVQIAGASELMSPASEPNTLVVPVCALVPTPDGGHGMYVSVSGASPFLFIPVTLVERGAALEGAPLCARDAAQDEIEGEGEGDLDGVWAPRRLGRRGRDRIEAQD